MFKHVGRYLLHPLFLCLISFACCFCLALILFFPLQPFTQQFEELARKQGIELHIKTPERSFPLAITAESIQFNHPDFPQRPVQLENLEIDPLWSSLTSGNPGIHFKFEAYQGFIQGTALRNGQVDVTVNELILNETLEPQYPLNISGLIDTAKFSGILPLQGNNRS